MTEGDSNIVEWRICEIQEIKSKERKTKRKGTTQRKKSKREKEGKK